MSIFRFFLTTSLFCVSTNLFGQSIGDSSLFNEIVLDWNNAISLEASCGHFAQADISGGRDGDMASTHSSITLKAQGISKSKIHALTSYITYQRKDFDFDCINNPFSEINTLTASTFYVYNIDSKWAIFANGLVDFSAEEFCDWENGVHGFIAMGAIYTFSETFRLGFGAGAYSRLDTDWTGFPLIFIDWQITEKLSLRTYSGASLLYDVYGNEKLVFDITTEYKNTYSRLKDESSIRDSYWLVTVGATWKPTRNTYIGVHIGASFEREIKFRRSTTSDIESDATAVVFINAGFMF
jgi:hypothetical protein